MDFRINDCLVGDFHRPYIVAEAGVHHYNSVELAKAHVLAARIAGADAVKWQAYKAERLAAKWAPVYWAEPGGKTQFDVFASRALLSVADYESIAAYSKELGVAFIVTPFDSDSARDINDLGVGAFKIASADITNLPLIQAVAGYGKPVILSTGASTIEEVRLAVEVLKEAGVPISLLHCTLTYPTPLADANIGRVRLLKQEFPSTVIGYSDHTLPQDSELACPISVALGARIIEKHFTLNKFLRGDDHNHAVDEAGLCRLVKNCVDTFEMIKSRGELCDSEMPARTYARRSIVAASDIEAGTVLTDSHIDYKRPGTGLPPSAAASILGKLTRRAIPADTLILLEDIE